METGFTGSPSYKLRNTFPCVARILDAQFRPSNTIKTYEKNKTGLEIESSKSKSNKTILWLNDTLSKENLKAKNKLVTVITYSCFARNKIVNNN